MQQQSDKSTSSNEQDGKKPHSDKREQNKKHVPENKVREDEPDIHESRVNRMEIIQCRISRNKAYTTRDEKVAETEKTADLWNRQNSRAPKSKLKIHTRQQQNENDRLCGEIEQRPIRREITGQQQVVSTTEAKH
jgi:hypothetical protein